jgi:hypothetical protein
MWWRILILAKSSDNANYQTYSINFLIESSHQIQFEQKIKLTMTNKTQAFLKDKPTIELDNLST